MCSFNPARNTKAKEPSYLVLYQVYTKTPNRWRMAWAADKSSLSCPFPWLPGYTEVFCYIVMNSIRDRPSLDLCPHLSNGDHKRTISKGQVSHESMCVEHQIWCLKHTKAQAMSMTIFLEDSCSIVSMRSSRSLSPESPQVTNKPPGPFLN
jgi:hypothetical protein